MGLDTSHDAWHGAYWAFMRWRQEIARVAGLPPLEFMEGFWSPQSYRDPIAEFAKQWPASAQPFYDSLPIKWESLKPDPPLYTLLNHSDCDGEIAAEDCGPIADRLEQLLPMLDKQERNGHIGNYRAKTEQFIAGLRRAAESNEPLDFH